MYLFIVFWRKETKYRFIVSQILIQDSVLKMYLDTRYILCIWDTYLDTGTCISDTTRQLSTIVHNKPPAEQNRKKEN